MSKNVTMAVQALPDPSRFGKDSHDIIVGTMYGCTGRNKTRYNGKLTLYNPGNIARFVNSERTHKKSILKMLERFSLD